MPKARKTPRGTPRSRPASDWLIGVLQAYALVLGPPALLVLGVAALAPAQGIMENLRIRQMQFVHTSGSLTLGELSSEQAYISGDGISMVAEGVSMVIQGKEDQESVAVRSPYSRYYFGGPPAEPAIDETAVPGIDDIAQRIKDIDLSADPPSLDNASQGDLLICDPRQQLLVNLRIGEKGYIDTSLILWSETYRRFLSFFPFVHRAFTSNGSEVRIEARAFAADRDFRDWKYYVVEETPVVIEFQRK